MDMDNVHKKKYANKNTDIVYQNFTEMIRTDVRRGKEVDRRHLKHLEIRN